MTSKPSISVVTRTYNRPKLLIETAKHLGAQTVQDFEWVVIDDYSDTTVSSDDLKACNPDFGIKIFRNDRNQGLVKSAHKGISKARGTFILIHDDDDYLLPTALEELRQAVTGSFIGATGGVRRILDSGKKEETIPTTPPLISDIGHRNKMTTIATMFLKSAYLEAGGIDQELTVLEDWDLWLKLLLIGDFAAVPAIVAVQRVGAEDQTLNEIHLEQTVIMRNKYLRDDIRKNAIGLGYVTNIATPEMIDRMDHLLKRLVRIKNKIPFKF